MKGTPFRIRRKKPLDGHYTCPACGYDLHGLPVEMTWEHLREGRRVRCLIYLTGTCPECGTSFSLDTPPAMWPSFHAPDLTGSASFRAD
jgi:transcription elongation factor Elf1